MRVKVLCVGVVSVALLGWAGPSHNIPESPVAVNGTAAAPKAAPEESSHKPSIPAEQKCEHVHIGKKQKAVIQLDKGIDAARKHELAKAVRYLSAALKLSEEACARDVRANALVNLGAVKLEQGKLDEARPLLTQALHLFEAIDDKNGQALALTDLGVIARQQGRLAEAEDAYRRALPFLEEPADRAADLLNLASVLLARDKLDEAETTYKQALKVSRNYTRGQGHSYHGLCRIAQRRNDAKAVKDLCTRALKIYRRQRNRMREANVLVILGETALWQGDLDAAEAQLKDASSLSEKIGDTYDQARSYHGLCLIAQKRGNTKTVVELCRRALKIFRQQKNRERQAEVLLILGETALWQGDLDAAEAQLKESSSLFEKIGNSDGQGGALNLLGVAARFRGDLDAAASFHKRAEQLFRKVGNRKGEALALGFRGIAALDGKKFDQSVKLLRRSLRIYEEEGVRVPGVAYFEASLGNALSLKGKKAQACRSWARARDLYREFGRQDMAAGVEKQMADKNCSKQ